MACKEKARRGGPFSNIRRRNGADQRGAMVMRITRRDSKGGLATFDACATAPEPARRARYEDTKLNQQQRPDCHAGNQHDHHAEAHDVAGLEAGDGERG